MENENIKGMECNFALQHKDNASGLFWKRGTYEGESSTHYFFKVCGRLEAYIKTSVMKIEFQTAAGAAGRC